MDSNPVKTSILQSIIKNGFPDKVVKLPFKPVFASCKNHQVPLKDVLTDLKSDDVFATIAGDFIEFRSKEKQNQYLETAARQENNQGSLPPLMNQMGSLAGLQQMAQQQMAQMDPGQIQEIREKVENMSDEEKVEILKMISNLNPPEKE